jgi:acyl-coenzyme A synthetase/AMP-(fatty) acid ligase
MTAVEDAKHKFKDIKPGDVVVLIGDYQLQCIASLIALIQLRAIVAPMCATGSENLRTMTKIVHPQFVVDTSNREIAIRATSESHFDHPIYHELWRRQRAGMVLLSSGSSGSPKAVVHDLENFLSRFHHEKPRPIRAFAFMQLDHVGGIYNLFSCLFNRSPLFFSQQRKPDRIGQMIQDYQIEFLPISASFLNIMVAMQPWERFQFNSLKYVVYGAERVNAFFLKRISEALYWVRFHQTYGLSEVGLLRSKSQANDSIWLRIEDPQAQVRVRDGLVEIKSPLTMLGYLNAEFQVTEDGWYVTGDMAEMDEERGLRVIGRQSDLIRVAGYSVHPSEIEDIIVQMSDVIDAVVSKEENLLLGEVAVATVQVASASSPSEMRRQVRELCIQHLEPYKVPAKIVITKNVVFGSRFKKKRSIV